MSNYKLTGKWFASELSAERKKLPKEAYTNDYYAALTHANMFPGGSPSTIGAMKFDKVQGWDKEADAPVYNTSRYEPPRGAQPLTGVASNAVPARAAQGATRGSTPQELYARALPPVPMDYSDVSDSDASEDSDVATLKSTAVLRQISNRFALPASPPASPPPSVARLPPPPPGPPPSREEIERMQAAGPPERPPPPPAEPQWTIEDAPSDDDASMEYMDVTPAPPAQEPEEDEPEEDESVAALAPLPIEFQTQQHVAPARPRINPPGTVHRGTRARKAKLLKRPPSVPPTRKPSARLEDASDEPVFMEDSNPLAGRHKVRLLPRRPRTEDSSPTVTSKRRTDEDTPQLLDKVGRQDEGGVYAPLPRTRVSPAQRREAVSRAVAQAQARDEAARKTAEAAAQAQQELIAATAAAAEHAQRRAAQKRRREPETERQQADNKRARRTVTAARKRFLALAYRAGEAAADADAADAEAEAAADAAEEEAEAARAAAAEAARFMRHEPAPTFRMGATSKAPLDEGEVWDAGAEDAYWAWRVDSNKALTDLEAIRKSFLKPRRNQPDEDQLTPEQAAYYQQFLARLKAMQTETEASKIGKAFKQTLKELHPDKGSVDHVGPLHRFYIKALQAAKTVEKGRLKRKAVTGRGVNKRSSLWR